MAHSYDQPMLDGILFSKPKASLDIPDPLEDPLNRSFHDWTITQLNPSLRGPHPTFHLA
jgi:hypothetical protein